MKTTRIEAAPRLRPLEGVDMAIIGSGEKVTFIRITAQPGASFPEHSHPNEQIGICMQGGGILVSGGDKINVTPGATWTIPSNEIHSFVTTVDEPTILYEAWSPPREDYLSMVEK
jgi:quercetin dioxygenase-like cupin family protein